jgi:hypothetical protein
MIPLWLKLSYTIFVLVLIPIYWKNYGPANFLWFSDIALFAIGIALWTESRLLVSMIGVGVLLPEIAWNIDYFGRLLTGKSLFGLTDYMFDSHLSLFLRALSLFHVFLPAIVIWLLIEWGYEPQALYWQIGLAWLVLPMAYYFGTPQENINWVYGPGSAPQETLPRAVYFAAVMLFFPLVMYTPTHFLMKWLFNS